MLWFKNDYGRGAHPRVLARLLSENGKYFEGYGTDPACAAAARAIALGMDRQAWIHFVSGGTQANALVIDAILRPWECVLAAPTGHIVSHEAGAVEHLGHKIETVGGESFKIDPRLLEERVVSWEENPIREHFVQPKLVYISQPTEMGTVYSRAELTGLRRVCDVHGLILYIDGARLAYALGAPSCDTTLADIARSADVFYVGGTKCGALYGEAVCFTRRDLQESFRSAMKQNGAMCAKGWVVGLQFLELFTGGLYLSLGKSAVKHALAIREAFKGLGFKAASDSPTNQQFFTLSGDEAEAFKKSGVVFEDCGRDREGKVIARFCSSWATTCEDVKALVDIAAAVAKGRL